MKKLAKILIPIFVVALVMGCFFIFASAAGETTVYKADGTQAFTGTLSDAVAYVNDSATNGSGLTIKLNADVTVTGTLTITATDFKLDLNGRLLKYNASDAAKSTLFQVDLPSGVEASFPLITGNGNIHINNAALFSISEAVDVGAFAQPCLGAIEQLDETFNQLPVVDIDTMININVQGSARIVRFSNACDAFYAQNVNFYCSGNASGDKVNGTISKFVLNTSESYVRLVNSSWQGTMYTTQTPLASVCADKAYLQLDNCVARTMGPLLYFPIAINTSDTDDFEVVRINNSVLDLGARVGSDSTGGNLINMYEGQGTGCYGTIAIKDSEVTSYRFIEHGNFRNDLKFNLQNSTFKRRDHGSSSLLLRASTDVYAVNCNFEVSGNLNYIGGSDIPTLTFINCRFDVKPGDAATLKAADGTSTVSYDLSDTQYPVVLNSTGADTGITQFLAYTYDSNKVDTYGTGTYYTEDESGNFTLVPFGSTTGQLLKEAQTKIGKVEVARSASHNHYFLYTLTDPYAGTSKASSDGKIIMSSAVDNNRVDSDSNLYNDPYFTLGYGYSDGQTMSLVSNSSNNGWNESFGAMVLSLDLTGGQNGLVDLNFEYFGRGSFSGGVGIMVRNNVISGNKASKSIDPTGWTHLTVVYTVEGTDNATKTLVARAYVEGVLFDERTVIAAGKITAKTWVEGIRLKPVSSTSQFIGAGFGMDNLYTATYSDATKLPASFAPTHKMVNKYEAEVGGVYYETVGEAIDAVTNTAFQYVDIVEEVTSEISRAQLGKGVFIIDNKDAYLPFNPTISPLEYPPIIGEDGKIYVATVTTTKTDGSPVLKFKEFGGTSIWGGTIKDDGKGNYVHDGSADRYIGYDMKNPVTNIAYSIIDDKGAVAKVATNVFSIWYDLANIKDGYTFKLYSNIAGPGEKVTIPQTGTVNIDLNGYRIVQNSNNLSLAFTGDGATVNVYSSRPGAAIVSIMDDAYADKTTYYNYNTNNGLSFFNVDNANITFNLDGRNLTWAGTTLVTADSGGGAAYTGITINVNGGTYVQCGWTAGIFYSRNDERVIYNISNANFYLEGVNESALLSDTSSTYTVTIDGCVIVDNNNNAKCSIVPTISNFKGESKIIIRNTHVGLRIVNGDPINYTSNDATYGKHFTIGENVTSSIPFPAGAKFEEGCSNNTLETPTAHGLVGNVSSITVPVVRGLSKTGEATTGLNKFLRYKLFNTKKNRNTIALVIKDGGVDAEGNINPNYVIYNPYGLTKLTSNSTTKGTVVANVTIGTAGSFELKYEDYCWGAYGVGHFDDVYSATMNSSVVTAMTCNYASTVKTINYTVGGEIVHTLNTIETIDDAFISANTPDVSGRGGVAGLYELSGWTAGAPVTEGNVTTVELSATSVKNLLAVSSTLVLQDNFTYTILVKNSVASNITAFTVNGETVVLADCGTVTYGGVEYRYVSVGFKPAEIANTIAVRASYAVTGADVDSKTVGWTLSVANYASKVLNAVDNDTVNNEAKKLMVEALNYVVKLNALAGVTTDTAITDVIAAYNAAGFTAADLTVEDKTPSVVIDGVSSVALAITANGFKLQIVTDGTASDDITVNIDGRECIVSKEAGTYNIAINAYELARTITIGGTNLDMEAYYSYVFYHTESSENLQFLVLAIKAYGIAADAYKDSMEAIGK